MFHTQSLDLHWVPMGKLPVLSRMDRVAPPACTRREYTDTDKPRSSASGDRTAGLEAGGVRASQLHDSNAPFTGRPVPQDDRVLMGLDLLI